MTLKSLLRGEKVYLNALTKEDLPAMARWDENSAFLRLLDSEPAMPRSVAQLEKTMESFQGKHNSFTFAIRLVEGDALIGFTGLFSIEWPHRLSWLAIGIGEADYWGGGYGREAMTLLLEFGFMELNLRRIQLNVFGYNTRAIALYEKLGFQREGVYREYMERDGQTFDVMLYGLLRREWLAAREAGTKNTI